MVKCLWNEKFKASLMFIFTGQEIASYAKKIKVVEKMTMFMMLTTVRNWKLFLTSLFYLLIFLLWHLIFSKKFDRTSE